MEIQAQKKKLAKKLYRKKANFTQGYKTNFTTNYNTLCKTRNYSTSKYDGTVRGSEYIMGWNKKFSCISARAHYFPHTIKRQFKIHSTPSGGDEESARWEEGSKFQSGLQVSGFKSNLICPCRNGTYSDLKHHSYLDNFRIANFKEEREEKMMKKRR